LRDALAPEGVQVGTARVAQPRAHLQPVWLDQIERAQQAVKSRQNAQVFLRKSEISGVEAVGLKAGVDIATKSQQRLFGVLLRIRWRPVHEAAVSELAELAADIHQRADLRRIELPQHLDQLLRVFEEIRLRELLRQWRRIEIECLGG